jgi:hypothetical protein
MRLLNLPAETINEAESLFKLGWDVEEVAKELHITPNQARRIRQALMARDAQAKKESR